MRESALSSIQRTVVMRARRRWVSKFLLTSARKSIKIEPDGHPITFSCDQDHFAESFLRMRIKLIRFCWCSMKSSQPKREEPTCCRYCVDTESFRRMVRNPDGRFICHNCGHTERPEDPDFSCNCPRCAEMSDFKQHRKRWLPHTFAPVASSTCNQHASRDGNSVRTMQKGLFHFSFSCRIQSHPLRPQAWRLQAGLPSALQYGRSLPQIDAQSLLGIERGAGTWLRRHSRLSVDE